MSEINQEYIEGLAKWLRETKGIHKIEIFELAEYQPEYDEYLSENKKEWASELVRCDLCSNEWVAVFNINSEKLECFRCKNMVNFEII